MSTVEAVDEFLSTTEFARYQSIPLPYGRRTPGTDNRPRADVILGDRVRGKSVLDVGCYYGYFAYEAVQRGAERVVGIEPHPERYEIASRISALHGGSYEIVRANADALPDDWDPFDVVLCLNVIHHVDDPIAFVLGLLDVCRETLVLEFPPLSDPRFLQRRGPAGQAPPSTLAGRARAKAKTVALTQLMKVVSRNYPLVGVGNEPYQSIFYFSPEALRHLFVTHLQALSSMEFLRSPGSGRIIAVCTKQDVGSVDPSAEKLIRTV